MKNEVEVIPFAEIAKASREFKIKEINEIVNMKNKGYTNEAIQKHTGVPIREIDAVYNAFVNESIKNIAVKKNVVGLQAQIYKTRLAEAEENYETAKQNAKFAERGNGQAAVAAWHKIVVETADSYTNFLAKIGAIDANTYNEFKLSDEIKKERSPLEILIEANRKKLMEEIQKAKEETPNGPVPGTSTNNAP